MASESESGSLPTAGRPTARSPVTVAPATGPLRTPAHVSPTGGTHDPPVDGRKRSILHRS